MKLTLKERIRGLELILQNRHFKGLVGVEHVTEKLKRIREDTMIFHPIILLALKEERKERMEKLKC